MIIPAPPGYELLYWHPATDAEPGRLESAPVVAWSVDRSGAVGPITPRSCLNRCWESPSVGPCGLLYPDGRVDVEYGRFTVDCIVAFVARCRAADARARS